MQKKLYYKVEKQCRLWGLNPGPSDLQSDALPTELRRHMIKLCGKYVHFKPQPR